MAKNSENTVYVFNKTKQTFLAYQAEVADSILTRLRGLLGRRSLDPGTGLWIIPSSGIHTVGMLFDIDVVFLDRDFRVIALRELVHPFSMTPLYLNSETVLELPAHTIFKSRTEVGDKLVISPHETALSLEAETAEPVENEQVRA